MRQRIMVVMAFVAVALVVVLAVGRSGQSATEPRELTPTEEPSVARTPRSEAPRAPEEPPSASSIETPVSPAVPDRRAGILVLGRAGSAATPVAGALVRAVAGSRVCETRTGGDGCARLPELFDREVSLWVIAEGWGAARIARARIGPEPYRVELSKGARVRLAWRGDRAEVSAREVHSRFEREGVLPEVRVVDETAVVCGSWSDDASPLASPTEGWQATAGIEWTDTAAYLAHRLSPGTWRLLAARPGAPPFLTAPVPVTDASDVTAWIDAAEPTPSRLVKFVDALDGHALSGVSVRPWASLVKDFASVPGPSIQAGAEGTVELPQGKQGATSGRTTWFVESATHAAELEDAALSARPDERPLIVRVLPSCRIEGEAYVLPGVAAAGAEVSWTARGGHAVRTRCGPDGRFTLAGIALKKKPEEAVSLRLSSTRGTRFFGTQLSAGAVTHVVLGPKDARALTGRVEGAVTAGGRGLPSLQVALAPVADSRTLLVASTAADGSFAFDAVPVGTAKLRITLGDPRVGDAFRIASSTPLPVDDGQTTKLGFPLPDAAFRVTVVDATTGRPAPGVRVTARPLDERDAPGRFPGAVFTVGWNAYTDADGVALLPGMLSASPHRLDATDSAGRSVRVEDAVPGTVAEPREIRLALGR